MSSARFDDGDSKVFTNGFWDQLDFGSSAYRGTVSWTNTAGNSKVVRFIGTSITVTGGLQPIKGTTNQPLNLQFIIDGGQPTTYLPADVSDFQYVTYYQSPQLSLGEHVLTIVNMVSGDICFLDSYIIQANGGTAQLLQSDGSPSPRLNPSPNTGTTAPITPSPSTPAIGPSRSTGSSTVDTQQPSSNSIPTTQTSTSPSSSNSIVGSTPSSQSSSPNVSSIFSASVYQPTTINANGEQPKDESNRIPMIIAVATSALLLMMIVGISFFVLRRRRKQRRDTGMDIDTPHSPIMSPYPPHLPRSGESQRSSPEKHLVPTNSSYEPHRNSAMTTSATSTVSNSGNQIGHTLDEKRQLDSAGTTQSPVSVNDEALLPPYVA